jgi:predicted nucleic acid-binding protein
VSPSRARGAIIIDTEVLSADLVPGSRLAERYAPLIAGRPAFISFQTAAELRYGAIRRRWGEARMRTRRTEDADRRRS